MGDGGRQEGRVTRAVVDSLLGEGVELSSCKDIIAYCKLNTAGEELLKMAITKRGLSARAYDHIQKVARTIADLVSSSNIQSEHISEAIQYRSLNRSLWYN